MDIYNKVIDMNNVNKKWCVYMHTNKINNKVYVGITNQKPEDRWCNGNGYRKDQSVFCRAIKKYGWDNFEHIIFAENLTKEEAEVMEVGLIALYKTNCCRYRNPSYGYNMTDGGDGHAGWIPTEENRRNMSNAQKGKKLSDEHKLKISLSGKGRTFSSKHKEKISQALKGRTFSEEALKKNSQKHSVPVVRLTIDGDFISRFESIKVATIQMNIRKTSIIDCCKGRRKSAGGFMWMYESDYNKIFNSEGR